jgi:hypothetical protein
MDLYMCSLPPSLLYQNSITTDDTDLKEVYNIFSAFPDLSPEAPDDRLHDYPAVDSKADTLTQSQIVRCYLTQINLILFTHNLQRSLGFSNGRF